MLQIPGRLLRARLVRLLLRLSERVSLTSRRLRRFLLRQRQITGRVFLRTESLVFLLLFETSGT